MKKILIGTICAALLAVVGCKTLPSADVVNKTAYSIGMVSGYACQLAGVDDNVKITIVNVLDTVVKVVPAPEQTFTEAWTSMITDEIAKLVEAGKLKADGAELVKSALSVACNGIDFLFTRHPKWKEYSDIVDAVVTGYTAGFETVVVPVDVVRAAVDGNDDVRAYVEYIKTSANKQYIQ